MSKCNKRDVSVKIAKGQLQNKIKHLIFILFKKSKGNSKERRYKHFLTVGHLNRDFQRNGGKIQIQRKDKRVDRCNKPVSQN